MSVYKYTYKRKDLPKDKSDMAFTGYYVDCSGMGLEKSKKKIIKKMKGCEIIDIVRDD